MNYLLTITSKLFSVHRIVTPETVEAEKAPYLNVPGVKFELTVCTDDE